MHGEILKFVNNNSVIFTNGAVKTSNPTTHEPEWPTGQIGNCDTTLDRTGLEIGLE